MVTQDLTGYRRSLIARSSLGAGRSFDYEAAGWSPSCRLATLYITPRVSGTAARPRVPIHQLRHAARVLIVATVVVLTAVSCRSHPGWNYYCPTVQMYELQASRQEWT